MSKNTGKTKVVVEKKIDESKLVEKIRTTAYELFEKNGREHGRDQEHWFEASAIVKSEKVY